MPACINSYFLRANFCIKLNEEQDDPALRFVERAVAGINVRLHVTYFTRFASVTYRLNLQHIRHVASSFQDSRDGSTAITKLSAEITDDPAGLICKESCISTFLHAEFQLMIDTFIRYVISLPHKISNYLYLWYYLSGAKAHLRGLATRWIQEDLEIIQQELSKLGLQSPQTTDLKGLRMEYSGSPRDTGQLKKT